MDATKVEKFMQLAGQPVAKSLQYADEKTRALGAQLILSEVLEYVIKGLGIAPVFQGTPITDPDALTYISNHPADSTEMVDGLADVAYTMYWNARTFGVPLEKAYALVCDNNLEKFVKLSPWHGAERELAAGEWHCGANVEWPADVVKVVVQRVGDEYFAVGKDSRGKVRKPSTYQPVDLRALVANS